MNNKNQTNYHVWVRSLNNEKIPKYKFSNLKRVISCCVSDSASLKNLCAKVQIENKPKNINTVLKFHIYLKYRHTNQLL